MCFWAPLWWFQQQKWASRGAMCWLSCFIKSIMGEKLGEAANYSSLGLIKPKRWAPPPPAMMLVVLLLGGAQISKPLRNKTITHTLQTSGRSSASTNQHRRTLAVGQADGGAGGRGRWSFAEAEHKKIKEKPPRWLRECRPLALRARRQNGSVTWSGWSRGPVVLPAGGWLQTAVGPCSSGCFCLVRIISREPLHLLRLT